MRQIFTAMALMSALVVYAGRVVTDSINSTVLGTVVKYNVYLPNGFNKSGKQYAAVYLLHGFTDDYTAWRDKGQMREIADELIESGEASEMIIVMPNAGGPDVMNTWNGYFNMPGWAYEDFFFQELLPSVEKKYRAVGDKGHRAVMGLSMGGGGSTVYAQRHPDMFSSAYGMSAWLDNKHREVRGTDRAGSKLVITDQSVRAHSAIDFVANADNQTIGRLQTVRWYLDCGDDDALLPLSVDLHLKMKAAGIHSELRVRDGGHTWEYWHTALGTSLPFASRNFNL